MEMQVICESVLQFFGTFIAWFMEIASKNFAKEIFVQFSGAFFGASFAALIAIVSSRLSRLSEVNRRYRDELAFAERYNAFLLPDINIRMGEIEGVCQTLLLNRTERFPNTSYNVLSELPSKDFVESNIQSVEVLNALFNQQFRTRMVNQQIQNFNHIHQEMLSAIIQYGDDDNKRETYKYNLIQLVSILNDTQLHLRELKSLSLNSQASISAYLAVMPPGGVRLYLKRFTKFKPTDKQIKLKYNTWFTKYLR